MPDTYGVTPQNIADELANLFPDGFGAGTKPPNSTVVGFISDADAIVTLHMARSTGETPSPSADNARLARSYIRNAVKAEVIRIVYIGNDPESVERVAGPFAKLAEEMLKRIDAEPVKTATPVASGWASVPSGTTYNTPAW